MTLKRMALWCGSVAAALLGVAALAVALAIHRPELLRPWVERALTPRGGSASLSRIEISLVPPSLSLSGLAIVPPPSGEGDFLRMDLLRVELVPAHFFLGGPWVRRLEARGILFERLRPRKAEGPPDLTPLTRLFDIENLSLTDVRLRMAFPQGVLALDGLRLVLAPEGSGLRAFRGSGDLSFRGKGSPIFEGKLLASGNVTPEPAFTVDLASEKGRLDLPWIDGDLSGRIRLRVTRKDFRIEDLLLALRGGRVNSGPRGAVITEPIRLSATAGATLDGREPRLEVRGLDIGGLFVARGRLGGSTLEKISGTMDGEIPRVERLKDRFAPLLPGALAGMELTGRLPWRVSLSGGFTAGVLTLELLPSKMEISLAGAGLGCRIGGTIKAEGPLGEWRHGKASMSGRVLGTARVDRPPLAVRGIRFETTLAGAVAAPSLPEWILSAEQGDVLYEGRPLPLGPVAIRGSARPMANTYRVERVEIRSGSLGRLTVQAEYNKGNVFGTLNGERLPADNLVTLAAVLGGYEWGKWSPAGAIDIAARMDPAEGGSRLAAKATLDRIGFRSPDGDAMGQLLAGTIDLEADLDSRPGVKIGLALQRGEALWGTVYLDLAKSPLDLRVGGVRAGRSEYGELFLDGGLAGFGRMEIKGKARLERGKWRHQGRIALRDTRLGPLFRTFVRDPLASSHPDLAGMELDGSAEAAFSFSGTGKTADVDGRLRLRVGDLHRGAEPPLLSDLDLDLPISYSFGAANPGLSPPADERAWGRLHLGKARVAGQELGPLEIPAILVPNRLHFGKEIGTSLYGANLTLRRIRVDDPLSGDFRIRMAADLDKLELSRVAGKNPVQGHIGGVLDPVIIGPERVTADGALAGDLFGGRLNIRRVTVERPFRPEREVGADVSIDRIDLEPLSAVLGIGRITGRLSGSIEGLRVAFGQPVAFHLRMESVAMKGVSQSVSLKAVNSISLMGTGSSLGGLGISLMTTFFREFPYEKIGFECGLKNDVFTVRGLIHEGGVEYLVKRRFFSGIDVINGNPDNRIGFSDMLERAKRVTGERSD